MSSPNIKPIIFSTVALVGVAAFIVGTSIHVKPKTVAAANTPTHERAVSSTETAWTAAKDGGCVAPLNPHIPVEALTDLQARARELVGQKRFAEALPEFRQIAEVDPGFPGLNLDMSVALLQLKQTGEAKAAVDKQVGISECLSKLPAEALQAYCKSEMGPSSVDGCQEQTKAIRQHSYYQAAIVQMEMGRTMNNAPEVTAAEAAPVPLSQPKMARISVGPREAAQPAQPKAVKGGKDRTLQMGAGTDAELGAYSKD